MIALVSLFVLILRYFSFLSSLIGSIVLMLLLVTIRFYIFGLFTTKFISSKLLPLRSRVTKAIYYWSKTLGMSVTFGQLATFKTASLRRNVIPAIDTRLWVYSIRTSSISSYVSNPSRVVRKPV